MRFENKVAIITGGAAGIGAALARLLVAEGGRVVAADLNEDMGAALAAELGENARFVRCDVTKQDDVTRLLDVTLKSFGRLDLLFNNAGKGHINDVTTLDAAAWHDLLDTNLTSAFLLTKAALPHLKASGNASIVNTCSVSGLAGDYGMFAYNAAKAGLINFTRALALDHAKHKIRVNAVCPGVIGDTVMTAHLRSSPQGLAPWNASIPMGRTGRATEVAEVLAFVASDAASYMTGSVLVVDGGLTAHTGMPIPSEVTTMPTG
jgi:meso-butanediol dehydrogenase/(S,S)-butanediol dehydrogenase/diacetyl reductase